MTLDTKHRRATPSAHRKKAMGAHQKHDSKFLKTYWPYLPMLGLAGLIIISSSRMFGVFGTALSSVSCFIAAVAIIV